LQEVPAGATLVVQCDIEPVVQVRQLLEAAGWEVAQREFSPLERAFKLTARKKG
jgi:hypothetical protein